MVKQRISVLYTKYDASYWSVSTAAWSDLSDPSSLILACDWLRTFCSVSGLCVWAYKIDIVCRADMAVYVWMHSTKNFLDSTQDKGTILSAYLYFVETIHTVCTYDCLRGSYIGKKIFTAWRIWKASGGPPDLILIGDYNDMNESYLELNTSR